MPKVVITGANGFIGSTLVDHFNRQGFEVVALVRDPSMYKSSKRVKYTAYDLTRTEDFEFLKDADLLIHTAYIKVSKLVNAEAQNIKGSKRLLEASRKYNVRKNIFLSSMSARNDAISSYGKQKNKIEKLFNTKFDAVIRSGLVLGDGGLGKQMINFMKSKRVVPLIGGGIQPLQTIHIDDLISAIDSIFNRNLSDTFTVAEPQAHSYKEFYKTVSRSLGVKVLLLPVSIELLVFVIKTAHFLRLPVSVNEDNVRGLQKLRAIDTTADLKKLHVTVGDLESSLQKLKGIY